jgi:ribonuclease HI
MSSYTVATDGACMRNPGPAGWAWVGEDGRWAAGSLEAGTNNIGELLAVLYAIRDNASVEHLLIQADSMYAINSYRTWMDAHARRGWKTSTGAPTKNADILAALIQARDARRATGLPDVVFEHVKGHAGHRPTAGRTSGPSARRTTVTAASPPSGRPTADRTGSM